MISQETLREQIASLENHKLKFKQYLTYTEYRDVFYQQNIKSYLLKFIDASKFADLVDDLDVQRMLSSSDEGRTKLLS